ncbi:MAG: SDR family NAD(P)-dependent oxidoreductase [Nitrospiria bacterium]
MKRPLSDKIALVTGGSRGIGYAIAEAYLRAGARVIICARDKKKLQTATDDLRGAGEVLGISCDVSRLESVFGLVGAIVKRHGKIDLLVNNAAVGMTYGRVADIDPIRWAEVICTNLIGTFYCCHAVLPYMMKQKSGGIINLKGYGAAFPSPRVTAYGASKAGVKSFTRSLAREYKDTGICVNLLSPGIVKTSLLINRDASAEGAAYLERMRPFIDHLAQDADDAARLAVKIAEQSMQGTTGKEFRVRSKTSWLFSVAGYALKQLANRITGRTAQDVKR